MLECVGFTVASNQMHAEMNRGAAFQNSLGADSGRGTGDELFIVDDDPSVRDALALFFTHAGFRVSTFEDGKSVIRAAHEASPACILLDIYLSGESGMDILRALEAAHFAAPVFIITGRSDVPTAVNALRNGAADYLEKRMDAETIVSRVCKALDVWRRRQHGGDGSTSRHDLACGM
jgi:two-component system response regulator FixJ